MGWSRPFQESHEAGTLQVTSAIEDCVSAFSQLLYFFNGSPTKILSVFYHVTFHHANWTITICIYYGHISPCCAFHFESVFWLEFLNSKTCFVFDSIFCIQILTLYFGNQYFCEHFLVYFWDVIPIMCTKQSHEKVLDSTMQWSATTTGVNLQYFSSRDVDHK